MNTVTFAPVVFGIPRESGWTVDAATEAARLKLRDEPMGPDFHRNTVRFTSLSRLLRHLADQRAARN